MTTFKARMIALFVPLLAFLAFATTPAMAQFGLERFAIGVTNQNGSPDVQAGSHPFALTSTFVLNGSASTEEPFPPQGDLRDVRLELPPGFVGDPNATPKCTYSTFISEKCPNETVVGAATTYNTGSGPHAVFGPEGPVGLYDIQDPIYNLEPPAGVAAQFGFIVANSTPVFLDTSVRGGRDYGLTTNVSEINQAIVVAASKVTIWGVPAAPSHNEVRGTCLLMGAENIETSADGLGEGEEELETARGVGRSCPVSTPEVPLLTNPTSCGVSRTTTLSVDSWEESGNFSGERTKTASLPELSGCEKLNFSPAIGVLTDGTAGSTPTGLNVGVDVPQGPTSNPLGLAEADVRDTTVTLPQGVQLSPSAADGLQACSEEQIGFTRFEELPSQPGVQTAQFTPETPSCPNASKIANVKIKTPLLEEELEGALYVAAPQNFSRLTGALQENPFESLVALYLVAEDPARGVLLKLAGKVTPNPETGQLTTTFENTPQLPFSELKLEFYGTDRAPLATPALCGTYTTAASFVSWGDETRNATSSFSIESGPEVQTAVGPQKTPCPNPSGQSLSTLPFSPSLSAQTTNVQAGAFSPLTMTMSREDGQQNLSGITLHYPPGLSGILTGIPLCGEAEANAGTCSSASEIGETIVSVGLGNDPFSVTGGKVYLTGPYDGAPFGLSIVNPAKAGPFDLQEGHPVIVRAKIEINPTTAALTVTTTGEIPHIIDGIPLQIKHVNVNVTRHGFTFNPTSCDPMKVEGAITSVEGGSSAVSDPFQVTNCQALKFTPKFAVSTSGKASKADGASLTAKLAEPSEPQGSQANIAKVKVELPKQLPSRLTTLQKACTDAQFEANPANCPKESKIGYAVVRTPLLPVPLEGPAIFVSHGGEAYPSLTMVLQGYGVTIDLVGATFISKAGITSTTFKTVPDVPFSTFELTLPKGPYSALTTNLPHESHDLCGQKLAMPTEFIAQDGAAIKESTDIALTGCAPAITVASHKVKGKTATIQVSVPAAGKLVATGKGLSKASKTATGATTLTVKLTLTNAESAALSRHKGRKLRAKINLVFTPKKGGKLKTTTTVLIG